MQLLAPSQRATLAARLLQDRPGPQVATHVLKSGHGACFADRWPDPRALFSMAGPNYSLLGDPGALLADDLSARIAGMVDAPAEFEALLEQIVRPLGRWSRVISRLEDDAPPFEPPGAALRPLTASDAHHVYALTGANLWIAETWGGAQGMCEGGMAWGAFVDDRLASVAVSFYVGEHFEDIGVVTEPEFRGRGLSVGCASALCRDIRLRGRTPSWSTSPDNLASLRVAEKLGFVRDRDDVLYVVHDEIPQAAVLGKSC